MIDSPEDDDDRSDEILMVDLGDAKTETMHYMPGGIIPDSLGQLSWFG